MSSPHSLLYKSVPGEMWAWSARVACSSMNLLEGLSSTSGRYLRYQYCIGICLLFAERCKFSGLVLTYRQLSGHNFRLPADVREGSPTRLCARMTPFLRKHIIISLWHDRTVLRIGRSLATTVSRKLWTPDSGRAKSLLRPCFHVVGIAITQPVREMERNCLISNASPRYWRA